MIYLLYIAIGYLVLTSLIMYWNRKTFGPLQTLDRYVAPSDETYVSICIPARNEENTIKRCVESVLNQEYSALEVLVLDDNSSDKTLQILESLETEYSSRLKVVNGKPKPNDWLGKPWACHQLSERANGDILIFIDADVWLEPETVKRIIRTMGRDIVDFVTVWPRQHLGSLLEKIVIPQIYYVLVTLLPIAWVHKIPKWIPPFLRSEISPLFAAACGQFMAFKKSAYHKIGGHKAVKNKIIEDGELAKNIKRAGLPMKMYHGIGSVHCRMYYTTNQIQEGFRKNFLAGFNYNIPLFIIMGLLHIIVFLVPFLTLFYGFISGSVMHTFLSSAIILFFTLQRIILDSWFKWNPLYSLLHAAGVLWFQLLGIIVLRDYSKDLSVTWKGREIKHSKSAQN